MKNRLALVFDGFRGLTKAGILRFGLTLLSLTGALSFIFNATTLISYIAAVSFLSLAGMLGQTLVSRSRLREKNRRDRELFERYIDEISKRAQFYWKMTELKKTLEIDSNGDTHDLVAVKAIAVDQELTFFRLHVGCGWKQPVRQRRKVVVRSCSPISEGVGGVDHEVTTSWLTQEKLEVLVHFHSPVPAGEEFVVLLSIAWPGKCRPFMRDFKADHFMVNFQAPIGRVEYTLKFPPGFEARCQPVGFKQAGIESVTLRPPVSGKSPSFTIEATGVDGGCRFGVILQQKKGGHDAMASHGDD
ncbi:hypothetical protein [Amycolatopsis sp. TNS106]|uniref:hypothetical protein n=1 Tax=Amycolatopsis sp. TNS106 TaxID=2861750 RepID=UPI001C59CDF6|nr:hypothetical protein [Amycolatopsis sp. TNS106]QXV60987.1 hypothetical protein CVV72_30985 [Amycolatopsis sp. TNS106]